MLSVEYQIVILRFGTHVCLFSFMASIGLKFVQIYIKETMYVYVTYATLLLIFTAINVPHRDKRSDKRSANW